MRLIIKDYLLQLKEKDELDLLLCDLLLQMGYVTDSKPETGNRQYGVDIRAHNNKKILLFVIKQGNLNRENWDSGQNAVRQSLNDIRDVYMNLLGCEDRKKELHIVVATNGVMDEAVRPNWEGYVKQNTLLYGIKVYIDFWHIDILVDYIQNYLFDEHMFGSDMQALLRRALYFIGEGDYRNKYFENIIDFYLTRLSRQDRPKERKKRLASLYMASQMVAQYAAQEKIYKISIMVSEYLLIRFWKYLLENNLLGKKQYVEWLHKFLIAYEKWNQEYYNAVKYCCEGEDRIPFYNPVEQRVLLYEILGYLISYAYYLSFKKRFDNRAENEYHEVYNNIIQLINNHSQFPYAPYDQHVGIISMLYRLADRMGRVDDINVLMEHQCTYLEYYYIWFHKYPASSDSFEDAVNIDMNMPAEDYITSAFWGTMIEWMVLINQKNLYQKLQIFLSKDLETVTKCAWFFRAKEELIFYDSYAMNKAGEGVSFETPESFEKLKENVDFIMKQYEGERYSFEEYSFEALEFIICRYYGYLPRVKREQYQ